MGSVRLTKGCECDIPMAQRKGLIGNKKTNLPRRRNCSADSRAAREGGGNGMTNLEHYKDKILGYSKRSFCSDFVEPIILKQFKRECGNTSCEQCRLIYMIWLNEEYKEPEPDWSMVAVDTPILVSDGGIVWYRGHFAKYKDGHVYAWNSGGTSFTAYNSDNITYWEYAKLPEVEE